MSSQPHLAVTPEVGQPDKRGHEHLKDRPADRAGCPLCNAPVFRISRRLTDLLISLFVPIQRFRCISMACTWEGVRRERTEALPDIARTSS
jgi:hypothetical protein